MSEKLVRDRIREAPGFQPCGNDTFRRAGEGEHARLLARKILEEYAELMEAAAIGTEDDIVTEAADLIQAIYDYVDLTANRGLAALQSVRLAKRAERGDFSGGLVWSHP